MALYSHIRCLLCGSQNTYYTKVKFAVFNCPQAPVSGKDNSNPLNNFTTRLVEKRAKNGRKINFKNCLMVDKTNTERLTSNDTTILPEEVNIQLKGAIELCDNRAIANLTQHCIEQNILPPLVLLLQALSVCSQIGDRKSIIEIVQLCEKVRPEILGRNSHFQHYVAEAIWIKGNVAKSLNIFEQVYRENPFLRQKIRLMLKCLITDSIKTRSEATLVILVKFCTDLTTNYSDFYPLVCIWEASFLSEWFSDHCLAMELIDRNPNMLEAIEIRLPHVVHVSLSQHKTEVVYRLTDILLKNDKKVQAAQVFFGLMDYWIKQGAIKRCLQLVQWSNQHDIKLPAIHQVKFIELLTNEKCDNLNSKMKPKKDNADMYKPPPTQYKF